MGSAVFRCTVLKNTSAASTGPHDLKNPLQKLPGYRLMLAVFARKSGSGTIQSCGSSKTIASWSSDSWRQLAREEMRRGSRSSEVSVTSVIVRVMPRLSTRITEPTSCSCNSPLTAAISSRTPGALPPSSSRASSQRTRALPRPRFSRRTSLTSSGPRSFRSCWLPSDAVICTFTRRAQKTEGNCSRFGMIQRPSFEKKLFLSS
mmetsp:Transcript_47374/g.133678  ORF Transcript_47374/g.133678 Transcript_47374/m.133678 type:complete len:204 (+) Transcript_47374:1378-1989(+)